MAKVRLAGASVTAGALAAAPVPVRLTVWGLPVALSVTVIVPGWLPIAVGVKVTVIVHCALTAIGEMQVLVCEYCALAAMLVKVRGAVPELVSVRDCVALGVFTV